MGATYTLGTMEKGTKMRMSLMAVLAVAFVLALGGTALAQDSPTQDAYGGVLGNEAEDNVTGEEVATTPTTTNNSPSGSNSPGGSLPFTGFETGLVALAGIGLVGLGFAMRRGTRRQSE
jgi:hypothetical protein